MQPGSNNCSFTSLRGNNIEREVDNKFILRIKPFIQFISVL